MIETRLLRQFVAVAEELHFHRAAARLHMAQPPLSQAIRRLEAQIGAPLFTRSNRHVALTPAGTALLRTARDTLQRLQDGVEQTRRVAAGVEGHLTVSLINLAPYAPLLRALRQFRAAHPAVTFTLLEAGTQAQVQALEAGSADVGFMRAPGLSAPSLTLETLLREPVLVALPSGHRLQAQPSVALADLAGESFVASHRTLGLGFHDQLVRLCQAAGFAPTIVQEVRQLHTLVALVAAGFGVALVPASLTQGGYEDVVFKPMTVAAPEALLSLDLVMAWQPHRASPVRDHLLATMREALPATRTLDIY